MSNVKKSVSVVYDTLTDMINDIEFLKAGMVVITLGKDTINDGHGSSYKIISNKSETHISENIISLAGNSRYHAEEINASVVADDVSKLSNALSKTNSNVKTNTENIERISNVVTELGTSIGNTSKALQNVSTEVTETSEKVTANETEIANVKKSVTKAEQTASDSVTALMDSVQSCEILSVINALNIAGIKIACLANGQKAIVVTGINPSATNTEGVNVSLNDNNAVITGVVSAFSWIAPTTLKLLEYANTTFVINDNCSITCDGNTFTITVSRSLTPAVYYYL